ncbi:MAG: hypothetical protein KBC84_02000 [Proteobacteria bacterium]|nr:hypothetical protein [Pseudomonadota bacterium]
MYYLILFIPAILMFLCCERYFLNVDSAYLSFFNAELFTSFPLVNFNSNAFTLWRFDPLFILISRQLSFHTYCMLLILQFTLSLFYLVKKLEEQINREQSQKFIFLPLTVIFLFLNYGLDITILGTITWLPLLVLAVLRFEKYSNLTNFFLLMLASILFTLSANQFSLFVSLIISFLLLANYSASDNLPKGWTYVPLLFIPLLNSLFYSSPNFPGYEFDAHLVPNYGVIDGLQPLIGQMPKLPVIDRSYIRSAYGVLSLAIIICLSIVALAQFFKRILIFNKTQKSILLTALVLSISVFFDSSFISSSDSQFLPLQSISRLMPGLFFAAVAPVAIVLSLILLAVLLSTIEHFAFTTTLFVFTLVLPSLISFNQNKTIPFLAINNFNAPILELNKLDTSNASRLELMTILNSPSYYLIREHGLDVIMNSKLKNLEYKSACEFNVKVEFSSNPVDIKNICDGRDSTRWTTKLAKQTGEEWLKIRFPELTSLASVRLTTGKYFTDFPRGVAIEVSNNDCENVEVNSNAFYRLVTDKRAEGEIRYTDKGHPFFSKQYTYAASVLTSEPFRCMLIKQIGVGDTFEWSVADLQFAK